MLVFLINPRQHIVSSVRFYLFLTNKIQKANVSSNGICVLSLFSNSSRPGRPPKRSLGVLQDNARLLPHAVPGLLSPGLITPTGNLIQLMVLSLLTAKSLKETSLSFKAFSRSTRGGITEYFEYSGKQDLKKNQ